MAPKKVAAAKEQPAKRGRAAAAKETEEAAAAEEASSPTSIAPRRSSSASGQPTEESILEGTVPFVRLTKDADFDPSRQLKIISWNVAGLRALLKKEGELQRVFSEHNPDVVCLQETKLSPDDAPSVWANLGRIPGYTFVDNVSVAKKGYSGTRTYIREGTGPRVDYFSFDASDAAARDPEGRLVTTFWNDLGIVNAYVPNSGMNLERLDYRTKEFDPMMRDFLTKIAPDSKAFPQLPQRKGGIIWTGDLNVAEKDYDRFFGGNFKQMQKSPGFTPEERASFRTTLSELGMVDAFRHLYPNASKVYSFWSARFDQRSKNNGWRLDYFVVSKALVGRVVECCMLPQHASSDHCPIMLLLRR